jgi:plastocyanin
LVLFLILTALALPLAAAQTTHEVDLLIQPVEGAPLPQFFFEPTGLAIEPGDTIVFIAKTPHHTVTAYHPQQGKEQRVPDGVPPFSSPVIPVGTIWEYTFDIPGVYDVWCGPHEMFGMAMRIVVGEASGPGAVPPSDFGPEGTMGGAGQILLDPSLDPERILAEGSVPWSAITPEAKVPPIEQMLGGGEH